MFKKNPNILNNFWIYSFPCIV